ncbi:Solute carrier family 28 member 3-like protein 1 [Colletotrichum chlorophyti]|uniref:Solute carrier family 28 member 3-like protein 1 n=1 Tax=Colletotrichum chlorophyti TaxID=708187 RepID=A0A1Q8S5K6_9PEZI|nr:Solute carrier family 28 member 3-like protein 1 [Colletotrichum chlorophyti]
MHPAYAAPPGDDPSRTHAEPEKIERPDLSGPGGVNGAPDAGVFPAKAEGSKAKETDAADGSDLENGTHQSDSVRVSSSRKTKLSQAYRKYRLPVHVLIWLLFTAWWIVGLVYRRNSSLGWLKPFLVYLAITIRIVTLWLPASAVMVPLRFTWKHTVAKAYDLTPTKLHQPIAAVLTVAVFLVGSMIPAEVGENTRASRAISLFGLLLLIALLTATSRDWRKIPWHTVIGGMLTQFVIAVFVLKTSVGYDIFAFISEMARTLLEFAKEGLEFLTDEEVPTRTWFLISVIPAIIFFISLVQLLYHCGLLQWFIRKFAVFFFWTLRVSGAEAVVATATPFVGQGESAMLIKPFVPYLTLAELHQVMTCGFATIAGSVLVGYISLGLNAQVLVSSCIMSIPASIAVSKLRYPETEESITAGRITVPDDDERASNALHAFANGAWFGVKVAGMILATLLCVISFVALINGLLGWFGKFLGIDNPPLSLQLILGYVFYPVAWCLGVPKKDLRVVGELIGIKIITNEYLAFRSLSSNVEPYVSMSARSKLIATYACCGFGNVGSLGTQIGVLSQIAPGRAGDVSRVALSALFAGVLSTLTSASVAGMLYTG